MSRDKWQEIIWQRSEDLPDDCIPIEPPREECRTLMKHEKEVILRNIAASIENGRKLHRYQLEYVAWGIRQHLDGRTPWPTYKKTKIPLSELACRLGAMKKAGMEYGQAVKECAALYEVTERTITDTVEKLKALADDGKRCPP